MLVLSRKFGERIVIDENVTVTVLNRWGKQVRLGIEAPPNVSVRRQELLPQDHDALEYTKRRQACTLRPR
jgi:carbon storage regulator